MAGPILKKRSAASASGKAAEGPYKKRRRQLKEYNSDSDAASDDDFQAVNLLDSDEDLDNAKVDDDSATDASASSEQEDSLDSLDKKGSKKTQKKTPKSKSKPAKSDKKQPQPLPADDSEQDSDSNAESDAESDQDDEQLESNNGEPRNGTSKRNDPTTFSTSLHKILGTKLSTSRRSDPVLSRSAAAHEASKQIVDATLEEKARRQMRREKQAALQKGRVKDVLIASNAAGAGTDSVTGGGDDDIPEETTARILATEKRLRKVAQRGVVRLFNAVRVAQVKAAEAQRAAKKDGVLGMDKREAKVAEMSRKGFLDLIASGGGAKTSEQEA